LAEYLFCYTICILGGASIILNNYDNKELKAYETNLDQTIEGSDLTFVLRDEEQDDQLKNLSITFTAATSREEACGF